MPTSKQSLHIQLASMLLATIMLMTCAPEPQLSGASGTPAITTQPPHTPTALPFADDVRPTPIPSPAPTTSVTQTGTACGASTAVYAIEATLDWATRTLKANQTVAFRNDTGHLLDVLVLAFPGVIGLEALSLQNVAVDDLAQHDYLLNGHRLTLPLPEPLAPAETVQARIEFTLAIPPIRAGYRHGHLGYLGYSERQINLGLWFPLLPPHVEGNGWVLHDFWSVGETTVLRTADFHVELHVQNAPATLRVAGPGTFVRTRSDAWQFTLCGSREVSLSLSDQFTVLATSTAEGIPVELFLLSAHGDRAMRAARHALQTAADAVDLYERIFGPFPFERLVVVEGDFPDGMEFSGLVFVSEAWFRNWQDVPDDWLTLITAHEVAHQWWYAAVGNDQERAPYLDEALATYSELLFIERFYPELTTWWWEFRINNYAPSGYVDTPATAFDSPRAYINTVYLQGARMLHDLRLALGDEEFFGWLARYAESMRGKVAQPSDFWGALSPEAYALTVSIRQRYLSQADAVFQPDAIP